MIHQTAQADSRQRRKHEILTAAEECELGRRVAASRRARSAMDLYAPGPELSDDEREYLDRVVRRGDEARHRLVECNLRLVSSIATKYPGNIGIDLDDLEGYGHVGLMKAADKFDPGRGRFTTYATWWIRQSIGRALEENSGMIRVPCHTHRARNRRVRGLPAVTKDSDSCVDAADRVLGRVVTGAIGAGLDTDVIEMVPDPRAVDPLGGAAEGDASARRFGVIMRAVGRLDGRSRVVILRRFGLAGFEESSLLSISLELGISKQRVQQIQVKAMKDLRLDLDGRGLEAA